MGVGLGGKVCDRREPYIAAPLVIVGTNNRAGESVDVPAALIAALVPGVSS